MSNINKQRKDYLNWDQYFLGVAKLSAMRSKDPSTQVGACIVGDDNRILSIGYNGTPNGFNDENSNAGAILLYLCSKVKDNKDTTCVLSDFFDEDTIMYYIGYIVALNAIGFTAIDIDMATKTIKSADIVDDLIDGANQRIKIESKNKFIIEHKQKIDDYFATKE